MHNVVDHRPDLPYWAERDMKRDGLGVYEFEGRHYKVVESRGGYRDVLEVEPHGKPALHSNPHWRTFLKVSIATTAVFATASLAFAIGAPAALKGGFLFTALAGYAAAGGAAFVLHHSKP
jgi:hypothetical protein